MSWRTYANPEVVAHATAFGFLCVGIERDLDGYRAWCVRVQKLESPPWYGVYAVQVTVGVSYDENRPKARGARWWGGREAGRARPRH